MINNVLGALSFIGKGLSTQVVKQAPKYGAKMALGIGTEVAIYYGSNAIIKSINKNTGYRPEESLCDLKLDELNDHTIEIKAYKGLR